MIECSFELNNKPMSNFKLNGKNYAAFSGQEKSINAPSATCHKDVRPIPPGTYFILDRESGGRLGFLYDLMGSKTKWFSLFAEDNQIDDYSHWCESLVRGEFRLHPKVGAGISKGCIVIDKESDFKFIEAFLRARQPSPIPGTDLHAWGKVIVK